MHAGHLTPTIITQINLPSASFRSLSFPRCRTTGLLPPSHSPQLARREDGSIRELSRVHDLDSLAGAAALEPLLPLLVAARGRLTSPQPSQCELGGGAAVMRELVEEEVYFKEHSGSGRVTQESFEVRREVEQREALLEDASGCGLRVEDLPRAGGLAEVLEVRQVFRPVDLLQGTLIQHVLNKAFLSPRRPPTCPAARAW
ncbi:hypothetical protein Agub_g1916 [Astrephomene gubernaculifera]|uniref:Uncharacterized protein n=1 Tax=Astrephomene gubernaculifera TaxID=47775 RepID=A0AAD3DID0_9CHLO|nr:hypothetical protein Agub_g1916 [Astrephomene gubernaculifera]